MAEQIPKTRTELKPMRERRGLAAAELARAAGVSRQTIYAIEDGSYVPNTAVALRLARALETRVEDLFSLEDAGPVPAAKTSVRATLLADWSTDDGHYVQLARVDDRLVAVPVSSRSAYLPWADGFITNDRETRQAGRKVTVEVRSNSSPEWDRRVVVAGCDPALAIFAAFARQSSIEVLTVACSSRQALRWLRDRHVHLAGSHLVDRQTGEHNLPALRLLFPDQPMQAATFARWQLGLVVRAGNPKSIQSVSDVASPYVAIVNREKGSGSRDLLDVSLHSAGIDAEHVAGYERLSSGHLTAAASVARNRADCCIASQAAARAFGLDFIPLEEQRFELCLPAEAAQTKAVDMLLNTLGSGALRSRLQHQAGYDCSETGTVRRA